MPTEAVAEPIRYYLLDALRGLAAAFILLWHYQHFFMIAPGALPPTFSSDQQPFYTVLWLFYEYGNTAVQLFFVLSGYIFFSQYLAQIQDRRVSGSTFFVRRIARLYPLHFAMLIIVAVLQAAHWCFLGSFAVYPLNDAYHFVLNLCLVPAWVLASGYSFNAPVWTISVETLLYAFFFLCARNISSNRRIVFISLSLIAVGYFLRTDEQSVVTALACFFAGGVTFFIVRSVPSRYVLKMAFATLLSALVFLAIRPSQQWLFYVVFPALIFCASAYPVLRPHGGRSLQWLGDISYAVYMVHFPLQLLVLGLVRRFNMNVDFNSGWILAAFVSASFAIAAAAHYLFEIPARRWIRENLWEDRRPVPALGQAASNHGAG